MRNSRYQFFTVSFADHQVAAGAAEKTAMPFAIVVVCLLYTAADHVYPLFGPGPL